ncbi:MAG: ATP-binding cassette domain-containing protein [Pseudonocardiales bacterium]|nr:ATP-binding cassette domain-containing protein [Pseudonocardiales bacterium]
MRAEALSAPQPAPLEVRVGERHWVVPLGASATIGRDDAAEIRIADPIVSRRHAVVESTSDGWVLTDHSRNGVFLDGRRVRRLVIAAPMEVRLGEPTSGVVLTLMLPGRREGGGLRPPTRGHRSGVHEIRSACVRIGRLPDNDVVLDDLLVSCHHAELHRCSSGWRLVDLASPNGTYVNGQRITQGTITEGDLIGIGHALLELVGDRLVTYVDTGDVEIKVRDLVVTIANGRRLLDEVGFTLNSRGLLAVVGPSGAGKSTLLGALTGSRPATSGSVPYGGRDLYANYDELRQRIGLVPQDDILHPQLTVRRALSYAAQLRFPFETPAADRERRIDEVLAELKLTEQAGQRIATLSGGQRKRTSVALELLTRPSLLFLDEPTSGLDPGMDKSVMQTLRGLADGGRTIVVVTHSVANLDLCDRLLVLAPGGQLAYYGPPADALGYFSQADFADLFQLLDRERHANWTDRFRRSELYRQHFGAGLRRGRASPTTGPAVGPRQQPPFTQFAILCRRYLAVIAADRPYVVFLAMLPLVLSLLARAVPGSAGLSISRGGDQTGPLLLVLIMGGSLMGAAAVRELVKERAIFDRERTIGLSPAAYLASKIAVLSTVAGVQAALFTAVSMVGLPGPDGAVVLFSGRAEIVLAVIAASLVAMAVGLVISAVIPNADRGMPLLVLLVMLQLILCGGLFPVQGRAGLEQVSWLVPARWAYAMGASTVDRNRLRLLQPAMQRPADSLWDHTARTWTFDTLSLGAIGLTLVLVTALLVHREHLHRSGR